MPQRTSSGERRSPATLRDVARVAGVVDSTVSRVLNGRDAAAGGSSGLRVPPQTRERILAAARTLNYRPNHAARSLQGGRTGVVVLVLPGLDVPSATALAVDGQRLAVARGYVPQVLPRGDEAPDLMKTLRFLRQRPADGAVILAPHQHPEVETELRALAQMLPLLLFSKWPVTVPGAVVGYEPLDVRVSLVMRHLIGLGRRRIAYLGEDIFDAQGASSADLYRREMEAAGLAAGEAVPCRHGSAGRDDARAAMHRLIGTPARELPDAVFAATSNTAIGAAFALHEAGIRVPQDVALATLGESSELEWVYPGVTSVVSDSRRPGELLGRFFQRLGEKHDGRTPHHDVAAQDPFWSGEPLELPARLVVRASTVGVFLT